MRAALGASQRRETSSTLLALELSKYSTTTQASHLASLLYLESPAERLLTRPAYKLPARSSQKTAQQHVQEEPHTLWQSEKSSSAGKVNDLSSPRSQNARIIPPN